MNVRHLVTALAVPCACIAAEQAIGQTRSAFGPPEPTTHSIVPKPAEELRAPRLPATEDAQRRRITMIESWAIDDKAEVGLGRFSVGPIARARTYTERVSDDLLAREDRSVAGAGLRLRFD